MAWLTRRDLPDMVRAYGLEVGLPFGLMLAGGAFAGLLALVTAGAAAAGLMLLYFGLRLALRRRLPPRGAAVV